MTYDPRARIPDNGTVTTAQLGGDVTALAKDLLTQETTTDAKDTLAVLDPRLPYVTLRAT